MSNIIYMRKLNLDENKIIKLYIQGKKGAKEISEIFGCCDGTIKNILLNHNIEFRGRHQQVVFSLEQEIFNELLNDSFFHYFLGFYVGDGCKSKGFTQKGRFRIGLKVTDKNRILLEQFRKLLVGIRQKTEQYFDTQKDSTIKTITLFHKKVNKEYKMLSLRFGLKTLKLKLDEWGLKINKKKCFTIPKYYLKNKKKFGIFLAGLIDADGWFMFNKNLTTGSITIALGDLVSCQNLQKVIKRLFDINTTIRERKKYNLLYFNSNHSYKKKLIDFKKYDTYIFPYIKLKTRQVELMRMIYNE